MKLILIILILTNLMQSKPQIIYVFDPFCSWCYVMSDVIQRAEKEYEDDFEFIAMSGGMILYENVGSINNNFSFLKTAYKKVEDYSGTKFGPEFLNSILEKGDYVISSLEPSIGIRVFKSLDTENQISFIHKVQESFYFDGKDIKNYEVLAEIASQFNVDKEEFLKRCKQEDYQSLTIFEFDTIKQWGITGYPTIIYKDGENLYLVASGYQYYLDLKNILNQIKSQKM
jgi:putative protein-disulfide isomerase